MNERQLFIIESFWISIWNNTCNENTVNYTIVCLFRVISKLGWNWKKTLKISTELNYAFKNISDLWLDTFLAIIDFQNEQIYFKRHLQRFPILEICFVPKHLSAWALKTYRRVDLVFCTYLCQNNTVHLHYQNLKSYRAHYSVLILRYKASYKNNTSHQRHRHRFVLAHGWFCLFNAFF